MPWSARTSDFPGDVGSVTAQMRSHEQGKVFLQQTDLNTHVAGKSIRRELKFGDLRDVLYTASHYHLVN